MITHSIYGDIVVEEVDGCYRAARKNAGWETAIIGACAATKNVIGINAGTGRCPYPVECRLRSQS